MKRAAFALSLVFLGATAPQAPAPAYDIILRNARVVDGAGSPWFRADVAISGDTIAAIGRPLSGRAARVIDVGGQIVSPGFIDMHTHARRGIFDLPTADNYLHQGVTTLMEGNDGNSPVPIGEFLEKVARARTACNMGTFIGHGSVREEVLGRVNRQANPAEMARMAAMVRAGMTEGAFGLSSGLVYLPGTFAPTQEVVALARIAAETGGIYITHMRDEAAGVMESVRETIAIGESADLPAQITHHKVAGPGQKGKSRETLRLVEEARARGVDVTMDAYPYMAGRTGLDSLLPVWAREGGREAMLARFADPTLRPKILAGIVESLRMDRGAGDPANVQISYSPREPELAGKTLAEITRARGRGTGFEAAAETVLEILQKSFVRAIFHSMAPEDVERIVVHPLTMIASDGEVVPVDTAQHPRSYGTFARVLGEYVREKKLLTLEEAVRKMTSFPAARLNLPDRGLLSPGMKADIVVFDPERVADRSTYEKPHQFAEGFSYVLVNGQLVLTEGTITGARPGKVLYGPGHARPAP